MSKKPSGLAVSAQYATILSTICTVVLLGIAVYQLTTPSPADSLGSAPDGGLMAIPILGGAGILGICTLVAGILNFRASRHYASQPTVPEPIPVFVPPTPDPYAGILSPLQLDALRLAGELLAFLPTLEPQQSDMTMVEWRRIVRAKYALQFQAEAVSVCQRLAAVGVSDHHFASLVDSTDSPENLADLARTLRRMAFAVFGD